MNPIVSKGHHVGIPNGVLGILIFIIAEIMFFSALISAYFLIRANIIIWPPSDQPRLPINATALNSLILILSGWFIHRTYHSFIKTENHISTKLLFLGTILCGSFFVLFQGYEWVRLISLGLTLTSHVYGAIFYLIIGFHGIHVFIGLVFLLLNFLKLILGRQSKHHLNAIDLNVVRLYWFFVVGLWPALYYCVYIY